MHNLKNLVQELEQLLDKAHGQLDTGVFLEMQFKVGQLKQKVDEADDRRRQQMASEALRILAALLSVVTNVMTLLK